jgi:glycosyltransferase involved in cell wall biosynthesis
MAALSSTSKLRARQGHTNVSAERVRVVFVIDNMRFGGTELNAVRTAELLDRSRYDLRVVCFDIDGPVTARYRAIGVPVTSMPLQSLSGATMLFSGWRFARYLRRERIQIVHAHDMYSNVFATVWARLARTPVIIASRRWWHSLPSRKLQLGNTAAFRMAAAVLANSPQVARSVHEAQGISADRIWTVVNFADDRAFAPLGAGERVRLREVWRVPAGAIVVGCVARLVPVKDHATLIKGFAQLLALRSNVHLVLIGDGECRAGLEALAARLGVAHAVTFVGELRSGDNHHRAFDVSALVSLSEGFPNTLVEAMAAGVPVVATAVGGSMDAVIDGVTGLLVSPGQPAEVCRALLRLAQGEELRTRLGAAGRDRASTMYRADTAINALQSMYDDLLERSAA